MFPRQNRYKNGIGLSLNDRLDKAVNGVPCYPTYQPISTGLFNTYLDVFASEEDDNPFNDDNHPTRRVVVELLQHLLTQPKLLEEFEGHADCSRMTVLRLLELAEFPMDYFNVSASATSATTTAIGGATGGSNSVKHMVSLKDQELADLTLSAGTTKRLEAAANGLMAQNSIQNKLVFRQPGQPGSRAELGSAVRGVTLDVTKLLTTGNVPAADAQSYIKLLHILTTTLVQLDKLMMALRGQQCAAILKTNSNNPTILSRGEYHTTVGAMELWVNQQQVDMGSAHISHDSLLTERTTLNLIEIIFTFIFVHDTGTTPMQNMAKSLLSVFDKTVPKRKPPPRGGNENGNNRHQKMKGACYNCGKTGHKRRDCTNPKKGSEKSGLGK